jgi:hypothetical protein
MDEKYLEFNGIGCVFISGFENTYSSFGAAITTD